MTTAQTRKSPRHPFQFTMKNNGRTLRFQSDAVVRTPKTRVTLTVTEQDVLNSIKMGGEGNTQTCTMALCCQRLAGEFSHPVMGIIDWQYRTCYVVSKLSAKTGLPIECYRYLHNSKIAHLNDDKKKDGQKLLLEEVRKAGGSIEVVIRPRLRKDKSKKGGTGKRDGSRSTSLGVGAKRRYAVAYPGLVP